MSLIESLTKLISNGNYNLATQLNSDPTLVKQLNIIQKHGRYSPSGSTVFVGTVINDSITLVNDINLIYAKFSCDVKIIAGEISLWCPYIDDDTCLTLDVDDITLTRLGHDAIKNIYFTKPINHIRLVDIDEDIFNEYTTYISPLGKLSKFDTNILELEYFHTLGLDMSEVTCNVLRIDNSTLNYILTNNGHWNTNFIPTVNYKVLVGDVKTSRVHKILASIFKDVSIIYER